MPEIDLFIIGLQVATTGFAWWLGLYLLGRDIRDRLLRFTGLGLAIYALGLAADLLSQFAPDSETATMLVRWGWPLLFLPALFWFGSLSYVLAGGSPRWQKLVPFLERGLLAAILLLYLLIAATDLIIIAAEDGARPGPWYTYFALAILVELFGVTLFVIRALRNIKPKRPAGLILTATLFFGLGSGLLLFPLDLFPRWLLLLAIGADLVMLGLAIAILDAFNQGEALRPDLFRSLAFSTVAVLIFGGQVVLVMVYSSGLTFPMLALLLAILVTSVATQTFADPLQTVLDWLVFARLPRVRGDRADLRAAARGRSRARESLDPHSVTEAQFARLTRRALGQMGNLPRLAASPLTRLEIVESRLAGQGKGDNTLERANELKAILTESIDRLKPRSGGDFGTADEWRHYNALYFPYVAGLKPYSRRSQYQELDPAAQSALEWFRSQVPERTLYNWQNAAARLIAQDLREKK